MRAVLRGGVESLLALALRALAGGADVHHQLGPLHLLRQREGARVEGVGELLVVLGDDAGAAAVGAVELHQLDVQQRRDLGHGAVQLGGEAARDAAGPVGDLHAHAVALPSLPAAPEGAALWAEAALAAGLSSSSSPLTYRLSS